jgi:polysaccharide export outer membrane protein
MPHHTSIPTPYTRIYQVALVGISLIVLLSGCKTREKVVYFNELKTSVDRAYSSPTLETGDFISVFVTCNDPLLAIPFNLPANAAPQTINNGYENGIPAQLGYLIDDKGQIILPVIGGVTIAGMTRNEACNHMRELLTAYLENPVVHIRILNFKVTVLGDVKKPGTFNVPNERITLLEALGVAGDLNITGVRDNVLVLRNENGKSVQYRVDLTQASLLESPVYYLKQNDVVYIEPNAAARFSSTLLKNSSSVSIPLISVILTAFLLFK